MDLGIAGKWALVCGASKGLGYGCALALVREGVNVVINARNAQGVALGIVLLSLALLLNLLLTACRGHSYLKN